MPLRALFQPLILRYGYTDDITARLAPPTNAEASALMGDAGLLIGHDEVCTLSPDCQLLFFAGRRPVIATKLRYYADREFAGHYNQA